MSGVWDGGPPSRYFSDLAYGYQDYEPPLVAGSRRIFLQVCPNCSSIRYLGRELKYDELNSFPKLAFWGWMWIDSKEKWSTKPCPASFERGSGSYLVLRWLQRFGFSLTFQVGVLNVASNTWFPFFWENLPALDSGWQVSRSGWKKQVKSWYSPTIRSTMLFDLPRVKITERLLYLKQHEKHFQN